MSKKSHKKKKIPKRKKAYLIRIYEQVFPEKEPGQYDRSADKRHLIIMISIIASICIVLAICWYAWTEHQRYLLSGELVIPETTFTSSQVSNVIDVLEEEGFSNIYYERGTGVIAFGTPEMVNAYKRSYQQKFLRPVERMFANDYSEYGIEEISLSVDSKILTFTTYTNEISSQLFKFFLDNADIKKIINVCATWCVMQNDGEKLTIRFQEVATNDIYYSTQATSASEVISQIEGIENSQEDEEDSEKEDIADNLTEDPQETTDETQPTEDENIDNTDIKDEEESKN